MRTPDNHFYLPNLSIGEAALNPEESLHAVKSFRVQPGDTLELCDGQGRFAQGTVLNADSKACTLRITSVSISNTPPPRLHLAIACLKDDALEEIVFHCSQTELASITFLRTEHSSEPRDSDLERTLRRCRAKSLASLKQSRKAWLTEIYGPITFKEWLEKDSGERIVCDISGPCRAPAGYADMKRVTLFIGPEGGFSEQELNALRGERTHFLGLGNTRLRAVTAPLFALGVLAQPTP
jgi:16S rRNA (uracil1498-N3)-methyltransferase